MMMYLGQSQLPGTDRSVPTQDKDVSAPVRYFTIGILCKDWFKGQLDFDGAPIQVTPNLFCYTVKKKRFLQPILEYIRSAAANYKWDHPFHHITKNHGQNFF